MSSSKKNDVISVAPPHSIKKFELISEYVKAWINILMLNKKCRGIVYIDCMSNSGVYKDDEGNEIKGTPLLVSEIIAEAMTRYTDKQAYIYFNDLDERKIGKFNLHRMRIGRVQQYLRQGHHKQLRKVKQHNQSRNMFRSLSLTP